MHEDQEVSSFASGVRTDMNRYKEALMGILNDIYMARPDMAPRVHGLLYRCDGVLALTERLESKAIAPAEAKELIGKQVSELMELTEEFLQDLSESADETDVQPQYYQGSAS